MRLAKYRNEPTIIVIVARNTNIKRGLPPVDPGDGRSWRLAAREGRFDYLLAGSNRVSGPMPAAEARLGWRTALTFPLFLPRSRTDRRHRNRDPSLGVYLEPGTTRIFQIWILPTSRGNAPSRGAKPFPKGDRSGRFVTLASGDPSDGDALPIRTDARVLGATLKAGETAEYALGKERHGYLVPAKGSVEVNGVALNARDGAAIREEPVARVRALEDAELVLVDAA